jgi:hypothetical protein
MSLGAYLKITCNAPDFGITVSRDSRFGGEMIENLPDGSASVKFCTL